MSNIVCMSRTDMMTEIFKKHVKRNERFSMFGDKVVFSSETNEVIRVTIGPLGNGRSGQYSGLLVKIVNVNVGELDVQDFKFMDYGMYDTVNDKGPEGKRRYGLYYGVSVGKFYGNGFDRGKMDNLIRNIMKYVELWY